jgi:hypothetical protein
MYIVFWNINGKTGHGNPQEFAIARAWVEQGNRRHGVGSHRMSPVLGDA